MAREPKGGTVSNPDERTARRPGFIEGVGVRLADGQEWFLPVRDRVVDDPEYDAQLAAISEAEDRAEVLRAELALTIFLLTRNYDLSADQLNLLLSFRPDDPALTELQRLVHGLAHESAVRSREARASQPQGNPAARAPGTLPRGSSPVPSSPLGSLKFF
jgi:hypothetical protein